MSDKITAVIGTSPRLDAAFQRNSGLNMAMSKGAGTGNYNALTNHPSIEGRELVGDKSFEELGLHTMSNLEIKDLFNSVFGGI